MNSAEDQPGHVFAMKPENIPDYIIANFQFKPPPTGGWAKAAVKSVLRPAAAERRIKFPGVGNPNKTAYVNALKDFDARRGVAYDNLMRKRWNQNYYARLFEVIVQPDVLKFFNARNRNLIRLEKDGKDQKPWDVAFQKIAEKFNDTQFLPGRRENWSIYSADLDPDDTSFGTVTANRLSDKWKDFRRIWSQVHDVDYDKSGNGMDFSEFCKNRAQAAPLSYFYQLQDMFTVLSRSVAPLISKEHRQGGRHRKSDAIEISDSSDDPKPNTKNRKRRKYKRYQSQQHQSNEKKSSNDGMRILYEDKARLDLTDAIMQKLETYEQKLAVASPSSSTFKRLKVMIERLNRQFERLTES